MLTVPVIKVVILFCTGFNYNRVYYRKCITEMNMCIMVNRKKISEGFVVDDCIRQWINDAS